MMHTNYRTSRLLLDELKLSDVEFIYELVNTPEWIKYIGDRYVNSKEDAEEYIQKLIDNPNIHYWVVRIQDVLAPIGVVTLIKRDYLDHHDIGFAFLARHAKKGYAYESATVVLRDIVNDPGHTHILATTIKENTNSIRLLEKLGLQFSKEIQVENEPLHLYSAATDKLLIDRSSQA